MVNNKGVLLQPENCCLHIVDPQKNLMKQIYKADHVIKVITFMVACARILEIPIIANTQYRKGLGPYVEELEAILQDVPMVDKTEFGALANADTQVLLKTMPKTMNTHILVGCESHVCIYQTAMGVIEKGFIPWVVADGVSSSKKSYHELALKRLHSVGAIIGPAEMLIFELLGKADTPQFKKVLPHILAFSSDSE